ncbi:flippase [Halosimplex sp. J119]
MDVDRTSAVVFFSKILNSIATFVGFAYFSRKLGPATLGIYFLYRTILEILSLPADLGLRSGIEKKLSETSDERYISSAILIKIVSLSVVCLCILTLSDYVVNHVSGDVSIVFGEETVILLTTGLIFQEFSGALFKIGRGQMEIVKVSMIQLSRKIILFISAFLLSSHGHGYDSLIFGYIISDIISIFLSVIIFDIGCKAPKKEHLQSIWDFSKYSFIGTANFQLFKWLDVLLIGLYLEAAKVSQYELAWRVSVVIMLFSQAISTTAFPKVSELSSDMSENRQKLSDLLPSLVIPSLYFVFPSISISLLFGSEILNLLFGSGYSEGAIALQILIFSKILHGIYTVFGNFLEAMNYPAESAKSATISSAANLLLNISLIPLLGITGAAIATSTSLAINLLFHMRYMSTHIDYEIPFRPIGEYLLLSSITYIIGLFMKTNIDISSNYELILIMFSIGALYLIFSIGAPNIRSSMKAYVPSPLLPS